MVKDIPLTLYAHHAPVAVAHGVSGVHQLPAIQADITGRMDRTFVTESLVRKKTHGIVQTGYVSSWVDEVIPLSDMADGRSCPIVRLFGLKSAGKIIVVSPMIVNISELKSMRE